MQQAGCGPMEIATEFERLIDMQYRSIYTMHAYLSACEAYGGATASHPGRPLHPDWPRWASQPGTKELPRAHDLYGSDSPVAFEFLFNARRPEALSAGLVDEEGRELGVCEAQLDQDRTSTNRARSRCLARSASRAPLDLQQPQHAHALRLADAASAHRGRRAGRRPAKGRAADDTAVQGGRGPEWLLRGGGPGALPQHSDRMRPRSRRSSGGSSSTRSCRATRCFGRSTPAR